VAQVRPITQIDVLAAIALLLEYLITFRFNVIVFLDITIRELNDALSALLNVLNVSELRMLA